MFVVMILAVIFLKTKETMIMKLVSVAYAYYILLLKILSCVYTSMESNAVFDEISGVHTKKSKCAVCKTVSSVLKLFEMDV